MQLQKIKKIAVVLLLAGGCLYAFQRYRAARCCLPARVVVAGNSTCVYDSTIEPAKIIHVRKDSSYVFVNVAIIRPNGRVDTLQMHRQPPYEALTLAQYEASDIRQGDSIACKHLVIKSGNCSPDIVWFEWRKFSAAKASSNKN